LNTAEYLYWLFQHTHYSIDCKMFSQLRSW